MHARRRITRIYPIQCSLRRTSGQATKSVYFSCSICSRCERERMCFQICFFFFIALSHARTRQYSPSARTQHSTAQHMNEYNVFMCSMKLCIKYSLRAACVRMLFCVRACVRVCVPKLHFIILSAFAFYVLRIHSYVHRIESFGRSFDRHHRSADSSTHVPKSLSHTYGRCAIFVRVLLRAEKQNKSSAHR